MKNPQAVQQKKALKVLQKHEKKLKKYEAVYDVALGYIISKGEIEYGEIGILVYVNKKKSKKKVAKDQLLPEFIDGIRVDVIETKPQEHDALLDILDGKYDPLVGGVFIGNASLNGGGTLGMIVKQKGSDQLLGLTNWHVIKKRKGRRGNPIIQPAWRPNEIKYRVGNLHRWNKRLDCAVFVLNTERKPHPKKSFLSINGKVKSLQDPFIGMRVMKSGGKTGVTHGIIASISSNLKRIRIVPNPAKHTDNNEISDAGDSGSIWITDEKNKKAVALHWGGDSAESKKSEYAMAHNVKAVFKCLELELSS